MDEAPFFLSFLRIYGAPSSLPSSVRLRIWVMAVEHAQLRKARRLLQQLGHGRVDFDEGNFSALKEQWSQEYEQWSRRDLHGKQFVYIWVDGIYANAS